MSITGETKRAGTRQVAMTLMPYIIVAAALYNYVFEALGSVLNGTLLVLASLYLIRHLVMSMTSRRLADRLSFRIGLVNWVLTFVTVLAIPFVIMTIGAAYNLTQEEAVYEYRLSQVLESRYQLYRSPYLPDALYGWLKKSFGRLHVPEFYDRRNALDSVEVRAFHLGSAGILQTDYHGSSLNAEPATLHFLSSAPEGTMAGAMCVTTTDIPSGSVCIPTQRVPYDLASDYRVLLEEIEVRPEFHVRHTVYAPGLQGSRESFLIDLRHYAHPPAYVDILFVTDLQVYDLKVHRVARDEGLLNWLLARPLYQLSRHTIVGILRPISSPVELSSLDGFIDVEDYSNSDLQVYVCRVACETEDNVFVIDHHVLGQP